MEIRSVSKIKLSTGIFGKVFRNLSWLFFAAFLVLLVLEGWEINNSVSLVMQVNQTPDIGGAVGGNSANRIKFDAYNMALQRIQLGQTFVASTTQISDPFSVSGTVAPPPAAAQPITSTSTGH